VTFRPAFDTAFKNWFHNESDPLAVMMGMKQDDHSMPKPITKPDGNVANP
jgi:hypothetical protein